MATLPQLVAYIRQYKDRYPVAALKSQLMRQNIPEAEIDQAIRMATTAAPPQPARTALVPGQTPVQTPRPATPAPGAARPSASPGATSSPAPAPRTPSPLPGSTPTQPVSRPPLPGSTPTQPVQRPPVPVPTPAPVQPPRPATSPPPGAPAPVPAPAPRTPSPLPGQTPTQPVQRPPVPAPAPTPAQPPRPGLLPGQTPTLPPRVGTPLPGQLPMQPVRAAVPPPGQPPRPALPGQVPTQPPRPALPGSTPTQPPVPAQPPTQPTAPIVAPPPGRSYILCVDDDSMIRDMMVTKLEGAGYRVTSAEDAAQQVVQAEGMRLSLIISDIEMPGFGTGVDALKKLRASNMVRKNLPVIFLTGMPPNEAKKLMPKNDPYVRLLHKPVDWKLLRQYIKDLTGMDNPLD